jgi:hypothetical protein
MNDFVKDIWNDLREKRLWPVAVVMLVGIVAIPAVLAKSSTEPVVSDPAPVADAAAVRSSLALDTETAASSSTGSSLDVFAPDDPFLPPRVGIARDAASGADVDVTAAGAGGVEVSVGTGGSTGETVDVQVDEPAPPRRHSETETTSYEYVADVSFWQGDRRRRIKGMRKLDMLPNETSPVLIFMGANGDGGNATFLVDSKLETAGEGTCRPSPSNCAFVDIGPGAEHVFTSEEGESFRLRVEEIRRVKVKASASASGGPTAHTSVGEQPAARRFTLPSLVDLVEVSTTTTTTTGGTAKADSSQGQGGR